MVQVELVAPGVVQDLIKGGTCLDYLCSISDTLHQLAPPHVHECLQDPSAVRLRSEPALRAIVHCGRQAVLPLQCLSQLLSLSRGQQDAMHELHTVNHLIGLVKAVTDHLVLGEDAIKRLGLVDMMRLGWECIKKVA